MKQQLAIDMNGEPIYRGSVVWYREQGLGIVVGPGISYRDEIRIETRWITQIRWGCNDTLDFHRKYVRVVA